jgi:hypothetical protein
VSTSRSGRLPLPGIAQRPDQVVVDLDAARWNHQPPVALVQGIVGERLDAQTGAINRYLHLARAQADMIAQWLRYYQTSCLIDGCPDAMRVPSAWLGDFG